MSDSFLTDAEIAELTYPLKQGKARCRYMERFYKVKVVPRPDGQPRVGRAEFNAAMMAQERLQTSVQAVPGSNVITPDWQALRDAGGQKKRAC